MVFCSLVVEFNMDLKTKEYIQSALVTESTNFEAIKTRLADENLIRILHAAIGIATESGEFLDALKKHIFYGKPLDLVNLAEEVGDMFWYLAVAASALGHEDFNSIMETNIAKLRERYGDKFTEFDALNRNLAAEREILERG